MDRFKLNTKALLGMVTRTVDQDHDMRHVCVKSFFQAVTQYELAMTKLVTSLTIVSSSLEGVEKAFKDIVTDEQQNPVFDGMKEVIKRLETLRTLIWDESVDSLKMIIAPSLSSLKSDCDTCDKLHIERAKAIDLYDYHRDLVDKKEVHYASRGKPLDASKHYNEEVKRRDSANEEYMVKNSEYNETHDLLMWRKSELTTVTAKLFLHWLSDLSEKLHHESSHMCDIVDSIIVKPLKADVENAVVHSHDVDSQDGAPNDVESEGSVNAVSAASLENNDSNAEQPPAARIDRITEEGETVPPVEEG